MVPGRLKEDYDKAMPEIAVVGPTSPAVARSPARLNG